MFSIRQIADELGYSKETIRTTLRALLDAAANPAELAVRDTHNQWQITDNGRRQIADKLSPKTDNNAAEQSDNLSPSVLRILEEQLAAKDAQIAQLTAAVASLTEALGHAQALHAGTLQQQLELSEPSDDEKKPQSVFSRWWNRRSRRK